MEASKRLELGLCHSCNRIFPVALLGSHHIPHSQSAGCAAWLCLLPRSLAALFELKPWLQALFTMPVLGALTQPVHFQPGTNSSAMTPSIRQWLTGHLHLLRHLCSDLPICRGVLGKVGQPRTAHIQGPCHPSNPQRCSWETPNPSLSSRPGNRDTFLFTSGPTATAPEGRAGTCWRL